MGSFRSAARSRRYLHWWWLGVVATAFAGLAPGQPAAAAPTTETVRVEPATVTPDDTASPPGLRIAQSSGPLDGLFSIFKPKPKAQRVPDSTVMSRKSKARSVKLPAAEGSAIIGSDPDPAPILVRPAARPRTAGGSRTMCVRLCDGYYWPVNSGTHTSSIAADKNTCENSCEVETRLFIRPSLGADAGDMRDLSGKPYRKLKTAFLYRKTYVPECKCRPDPWSASEQMRHEEYRAAATGTLIGPSDTAISTGDPAGAVSEDDDSPADEASGIDLATGNGGDEDETHPISAEPEFASAPKPETVSMPATVTKLQSKLPVVNKAKRRSPATIAAKPGQPLGSAKPTSNNRRAAIGRTIR